MHKYLTFFVFEEYRNGAFFMQVLTVCLALARFHYFNTAYVRKWM